MKVENTYQNYKVKLLFLAFLFVFQINTFGQKSPNHSLFLSIDRNLIVTGETLNLKLYSKENAEESASQSVKYVYCDLIGQDGEVYAGMKIKLKNEVAQFRLDIPKYLESGNYLIRAYTVGMRGNAAIYAIRWLRIVNPKRADLLSVTAEGTIPLQLDSINQSSNIKVVGLKESYSKKQKVICQLQIDSINELPSLSVSVVKSQSYNPQTLSVDFTSFNQAKTLIPEAQHLQISGKLQAEKKSDIVKLDKQRVYFSIRGLRDLFSTITDSLGHFTINLPDLYGKREVYITTEKMDKNINILIDQDYDNQSVYQWNTPFYLTKEELNCALELAQNHVIEEAFTDTVLSDLDSMAKRSFYGKADEVIVINDYIDLPNLSMYFTELPGNVHLHKKDGRFEARIINPQYLQLFQKPLIMVDYVVVNDLNEVLKMNPKKVNRIEIIRETYYKGKASFGGIINFITNKNDFGGYNFPTSSISMTFDFLSPLVDQYRNETLSNNLPDARNTLFWAPCINVKGGKSKISFFSSDSPGRYSIVVQGVDKQGNVVFYKKDFQVK